MARKEEEKKNNYKNSGHFVLMQHLRAAHALRSDQNMKGEGLQMFNCSLDSWGKSHISLIQNHEAIKSDVLCKPTNRLSLVIKSGHRNVYIVVHPSMCVNILMYSIHTTEACT